MLRMCAFVVERVGLFTGPEATDVVLILVHVDVTPKLISMPDAENCW